MSLITAPRTEEVITLRNILLALFFGLIAAILLKIIFSDEKTTTNTKGLTYYPEPSLPVNCDQMRVLEKINQIKIPFEQYVKTDNRQDSKSYDEISNIFRDGIFHELIGSAIAEVECPSNSITIENAQVPFDRRLITHLTHLSV